MSIYTNAKLYQSLPKHIEERSSDLIGLPPVDATVSERELVKEFLQSVSEKPVNEIEIELRKSYLLGGKVARVRPHKSLNKPKDVSDNISNRGKKRLTSAEKRRRGLLRLNKDNKTFQMFVPIHKMWKEYAVKLLCIDHFVKTKNGAERKLEKNFLTTMQNKLKKIEYFGCLIKVTQSRCSEYVGIEGIVIQETKNTFTVIAVNNSVKVVPKLHSEFSFILYNIGFSILGNHLHQRPVDRAKQNFKKHCLWL